MRYSLLPHPDHPPSIPMALEVWADRWEDGAVEFSFHLDCEPQAILLPPPTRPRRTDDLWKTTCFEAFVMDDAGYREMNFSPSGNWAAYAFTAYREGIAPLELAAPPVIDLDTTTDGLILDAVVDLPQSGALGLSAVIEEVSGTKSYWALAHPPGAPDFHHRACFAAALPPIAAP